LCLSFVMSHVLLNAFLIHNTFRYVPLLVLGVVFLVVAKSVGPKFARIYFFVFLNMVTASLITLSYIILFSKESISISRDIHIGLFGFLNARYDRFPLECFMVVVCNSK
jgi:hypothetical protein